MVLAVTASPLQVLDWEIPARLREANIYSCEGDSVGPYRQPEGNIPSESKTVGHRIICPTGGFAAVRRVTPLLESRSEELGVLVGRNLGVLQALGISGLAFNER